MIPMQMHMMMLVLAMATGINLSTGSATASERDDGTTVEIARGVRMPFVSDGIILDTAKNGTGEVKGLELWMQLGGRGIDTAWSYHNQPSVGLAVRHASKSIVPGGRKDIFLTTKIECMVSAQRCTCLSGAAV